MPLPKIAIVGRPNVGKSSLLNRLAGRRISIVDPTPGVTRDRVTARVVMGQRTVQIIDTGGMGLDDPDRLTNQIEAQIWAGIHEADLILFVVDARAGLTTQDRDALGLVRTSGKPILLVANKSEHAKWEANAAEFFALGMGEAALVSALEGLGIGDLRDTILEKLPPDTGDTETPTVRMAIVGKRNVGKSTLVNSLAGEERTIVSEIPGTTRDAVDIELRRGDRTFVVIDTAGLRKKGKVQDSIEFYGMVRSHEAILRSDVVVLMTGAEMDVSEVDKKLASLIVSNAKPCLIVVNKWDLVKAKGLADARQKYLDYLLKKMPGLSFAPAEFVTATHAKSADRVLKQVLKLYEESSRRVSTAQLNEEVLKAAVERSPSGRGKAPKIYYATQVSVTPPCFVLFVNTPAMFNTQYERYMATKIRDAFGFYNVPIKILFRPHHSGRKEQD